MNLRRVTNLELTENENDDLLADSHTILNRWKTYFSQILNAHDSDVRETEIHTAEPLVPEPNSFEVEIAIEKPERCKLPGIH
jgi:hypothetical protein